VDDEALGRHILAIYRMIRFRVDALRAAGALCIPLRNMSALAWLPREVFIEALGYCRLTRSNLHEVIMPDMYACMQIPQSEIAVVLMRGIVSNRLI
jgi:hypothetical protein